MPEKIFTVYITGDNEEEVLNTHRLLRQLAEYITHSTQTNAEQIDRKTVLKGLLANTNTDVLENQ